jgi:hypothetical protein
MASQISGTVTRKSNGSLEFTPADAGTFNQLPAMGDEVTVTIEVTRTVAEIERAHAAARRARVTSLDVQLPAGVGDSSLAPAPDAPLGENAAGISAPVAPERRRR